MKTWSYVWPVVTLLAVIVATAVLGCAHTPKNGRTCPWPDDALVALFEDAGCAPPRMSVRCVRGAFVFTGLQHVEGVLDAPKTMRVAVGDHGERPLWRTAVAHELMHACLWARQGDPEREHTGSWTKTTEQEIERLNRNARIRATGE